MKFSVRTLLIIVLLSAGLMIGISSCQDSSTSNEPNQSPTVTFSIAPTEGILPHEVTVNVDGSDSDGSIASYHFDADGDGTPEITQSSPIDQSYTYENEGTYSAKAWVSDDEGANSSKQNVQVTVESGAPEITMTVTPTEGLEPLEVQVTITQNDPTGDFEYFEVDFDRGDGVEQIPATEIDTSLTYDRSATITAVGFDQAGNQSEQTSQSIEVTPTHQVTFRFRNLTQDGEPFEKDFIVKVKEDQQTDEDGDGIVTLTLPEGTHNVNAVHPDYYTDWLILKEEGMGTFQKIDQRDLDDQASQVTITSDRSLVFYKIKKTDITSEENNHPQDTGREFYNMADVATMIDNDPPKGSDRFTTRSIIAWFDYEGSEQDPPKEQVDAIKDFFLGSGEDTIGALTNGYIRDATIQEGGNQPDEVHYQFVFQEDVIGGKGDHVEEVDDDANSILRTRVRFNSNLWDKGNLLEENGQGTGLRTDIGSQAEDDIVEDEQRYNSFGLKLGKILYWFDPGTVFSTEHGN